VPDVMDELMEKGDLRFEMVHGAKDGSKIPVEIHSHAYEYEGENRVLSVARDISKRKKAEKELKRSEKRFRKSFEALPDPAFLLNENGVFKNVNKAAVQKLGDDKEEMVGKTIPEMPFISSEDKKKTMDIFRKRKKGEDISTYELEFVSKNGQKIYGEINAGIFEENGFQGEIVIARDITEEKISKRKLKDAQQRLELALEGAELGVWDWNIETGEAKFNERWAEILEFDLEEVEQSVDFWDERVHPEDRQMVGKKLEKHLEGETDIYKSEHRVKTKSGDWTWIKDVGKVFERDENGEPVRAVGIQEDITKRKKAEENLKGSERKYKELSQEFENILDHLPGIVYYKDTENNFLRINRTLAEAHGMTKEEMEGKSLFDLYPEDEARKYWEDDQEVIENREPKLNMVEPWSPDEERWLITSKIPYIVDDEVKGIIGISVDITEEKKTQEREELLHTILRHDIKNKIQMVHGYLQLLDERELTGESKDFLEEALKGNRESINLLNKIRLLLRAQKEVKKAVNIASTIHEAVEEIKNLAERRDIDISVQCPSMDCRVEGGPLLKEVFSNIIENSVYHSGGDLIKISGKVMEEEVRCTIEDDGKGIPDEEKEKIFQKGYTTDEKRGTGLGMFLVKMLINTYGGKIEVKDSEMGGAMFDIYLNKVRS
ncbi:MAG: PAS domain S-box protein, partial [Thermoplasmata archaeon]